MVIGLITTLGVGILTSVLGIVNMMGNISTLHSYHRQRVRPEDVKPFGRLVGLGTLIIGISIVLYGVLLFIFDKTLNDAVVFIGTGILIVGIVVGTILSIYAMIKYNKGVF